MKRCPYCRKMWMYEPVDWLPPLRLLWQQSCKFYDYLNKEPGPKPFWAKAAHTPTP
jgi:hypothetical protein